MGWQTRIRYLVFRVRRFVYVVGGSGPIFRELSVWAYHWAGAIALDVYVHAALRVEGRDRFYGVPVQVGEDGYEARAYW